MRNGYNALTTDAAVKARQPALDVFAGASPRAITDLSGKGLSGADVTPRFSSSDNESPGLI